MPLTEQAAVKQMTDAQWILRSGPQHFRPTTTGMVFDSSAQYLLVKDFNTVVAHFQNLLGAVDRDWTASGAITPETIDAVRAALPPANIFEASSAVIDGMRKTIGGAA